jgi:tetratricopeptide (TPR) repeat protein
MLCKLSKAEKSHQRAKFLPIVFLNLALAAYTPIANAQSSDLAGTEGRICGTVLLKADHRPASQVAVSLKSRVAGIFRSIFTDIEGHFEVRGLPPGTYEIVVDEPGYESARASAQLDGPSAELVIYLRSSNLAETRRNGDLVSVRELKIPGKAQDEYRKGLERIAKNDPAGGLSHFKKATQAFPDYYEAHYHIGAMEMQLGHRDEAMQAFQTAIDLSGGRYAWAEFGVGYLLYLEGKPGEAERVIRRGLEVDGNSPDGYAMLGMTLLRLNRPDEAEKSAREALLRKPNLALAYLVLADVHAHRGEYLMQLRELDAYLKLDPNGPASERVHKAREVVLRTLAQSHAPD